MSKLLSALIAAAFAVVTVTPAFAADEMKKDEHKEVKKEKKEKKAKKEAKHEEKKEEKK